MSYSVDFRCPACNVPVQGQQEVANCERLPQVGKCTHCGTLIVLRAHEEEGMVGKFYSFYQDVAQIVWRQLTPQTKAACGARQPVGGEDSLHFLVTIKRGQRHKIEVRLDADDTYTVKLWRIRGTDCRVEKEISGIYVENLNETVYNFCNR